MGFQTKGQSLRCRWLNSPKTIWSTARRRPCALSRRPATSTSPLRATSRQWTRATKVQSRINAQVLAVYRGGHRTLAGCTCQLVVCGKGTWLRLEALHLEGRKRVTAQEFARGARFTQRERLGA